MSNATHDVHLPRHVRKGLERREAFLARGDAASSETPHGAASTAEGTPAPVAPGAAGASPEPAAPGTAQPTPKPPGAAGTTGAIETPEQRLAAAEERARKAEAKHDSLLGKYNAEVPRLADQVRQLREQLDIALRGGGAPAPHGAPQPAAPAAGGSAETVDDLSDDERRLLGDDVVNAMRKVAKGTVQREVSPHLEKAEQDRQQTAAIAAEKELTDMVGNWRELNIEPGFAEFLNGRDRLSRKARRELIQSAWDEGDIGAVAEFFKDYLQETGRAAGSAAPAPGPAAPAAHDMGARVVPSARGVAAASDSKPTASTRVWTMAQVNEFARLYGEFKGTKKPWNRGSFRQFNGTEEEAAELKREFESAAIQGRITK